MSCDVFMVEFRADVTSVHEAENAILPASASPGREIIGASVVSPAPPLLLLEYLPTWPGEPQESQEEVNEVEEEEDDEPTTQLEDEELEDNRESECEVSDWSEAFNSCASEVDFHADDAAHITAESHLLHGEGDEEFEDAIDLESEPSTRDRIAPSADGRKDTERVN